MKPSPRSACLHLALYTEERIRYRNVNHQSIIRLKLVKDEFSALVAIFSTMLNAITSGSAVKGGAELLGARVPRMHAGCRSGAMTWGLRRPTDSTDAASQMQGSTVVVGKDEEQWRGARCIE